MVQIPILKNFSVDKQIGNIQLEDQVAKELTEMYLKGLAFRLDASIQITKDGSKIASISLFPFIPTQLNF